MCLILRPRFLLLDEPFTGLDVMTRRDLCNFILAISRPASQKYPWAVASDQKTMVLVTHDIEEAAFLGDDVYIMTPGPPLSSLKCIVNPIERRVDLMEMRQDPAFNEFVKQLYSYL